MTTNTEFANVTEELEWRGALFDATPGAAHVLATEKVTCYNGFDPSASSLHIGSLVPIMGLVRLQRHGHTPIALVGGGTGMIGDPSFRAEERKLMGIDQIDENVEAFRLQLEPFLPHHQLEPHLQQKFLPFFLVQLKLLEQQLFQLQNLYQLLLEELLQGV